MGAMRNKILLLIMGVVAFVFAIKLYLIKKEQLDSEIGKKQYNEIYVAKEELKDTSLDNLIKKSIVDGRITFKEQDIILEKIKEIRLINENKEVESIKDNLKE